MTSRHLICIHGNLNISKMKQDRESFLYVVYNTITIIASIISTDEDPSLRIESSAIINLRGVSTKLNKYKIERN